MEIVRQTQLCYREGKSDKVYEVDLCRVEGDRYIVRFRYGRRGAKLREGLKTTQPVPRDRAEAAFDKLVASKTKKGYQPIESKSESQTDSSIPSSTETEAPLAEHPRDRIILERLRDRAGTKKHPLDRTIWRAGELNLAAATPFLIPLLGSGTPLRDYCIAASLGRCGGSGAREAVATLYQPNSEKEMPTFVRRIAFEALMRLSDEAEAGSTAIAIPRTSTARVGFRCRCRDRARDGSDPATVSRK